MKCSINKEVSKHCNHESEYESGRCIHSFLWFIDGGDGSPLHLSTSILLLSSQLGFDNLWSAARKINKVVSKHCKHENESGWGQRKAQNMKIEDSAMLKQEVQLKDQMCSSTWPSVLDYSFWLSKHSIFKQKRHLLFCMQCNLILFVTKIEAESFCLLPYKIFFDFDQRKFGFLFCDCCHLKHRFKNWDQSRHPPPPKR